MENKSIWKKEYRLTLVRLLAGVILVFLISGFASGVFTNYVFPQLSKAPGLRFLFPRFPVTVEKTEEIRIYEGINTNQIYERLRAITATVIAYTGSLNPTDKKFKEPIIGAGIVVTADGMILTTKAVASNAEKLEVVLNNGEAYSAKVLVADPFSEIVFLKIQAENLAVAQFENSSSLTVGEKLVAAGTSLEKFSSPALVLDLVQVPSAVAVYPRRISSEEISERLVVSPSLGASYSGAALANRDGRVVGIAGDSGVLTSEYVQSVLNTYLAQKKLVTHVLGLNYTIVSAGISKVLQAPKDYGALVVSVAAKNSSGSEGTAHAAGLQAGDFIYKINGIEISAQNSLEKVLEIYRAENEISVGFYRGSQIMTTEIKFK